MDSFEALFEKYDGYIRMKSRYYGRDQSEADELCQKAYIVIWQQGVKLGNMSVPSAKAFLTAAIKHALIDFRRREKQMTSLDALETEIPEKENGWENGVADNMRIMSVMDKLSTDEQDIVFKAYVMGMSGAEIGQQTHVPPSTVRSKLMRARRKLQKLLLEP